MVECLSLGLSGKEFGLLGKEGKRNEKKREEEWAGDVTSESMSR